MRKLMGQTKFFTPSWLKGQGFGGFTTIRALREGRIAEVPRTGGVYVVQQQDMGVPIFLEQSPGGRFKGRDPTVDPQRLSGRWIAGTTVLYIGKGDNLQRRLKQYMDFGSGKPIGHWGGRYIWQVAGSNDFLVAWKETGEVSPRDAEMELMAAFSKQYGHLPFANLTS
jgi:hypothetical protein